MDLLVALPLSFEVNLWHFSLVTQHLLLHRTTTWLLQSASCPCCILLRLSIGHRARHHQTLSWSRGNYERVPSGVRRTFSPTASGWISAPLYSSVFWNLLVRLPRSVLPSILSCWKSLVAWTNWWFWSSDKATCCLFSKRNNQWLCPVLGPLYTDPDFRTYND